MSRRRSYTPEEKAEFRRQNAELVRRTKAVMADPVRLAEIQADLQHATARVREMSLRNQVMLWLQAMDQGFRLRDVDTFFGWKRRGRHVRAGVRSLRLVEPRDNRDPGATDKREFSTTARYDIAQTDPDGESAPPAAEPRRTPADASAETCERSPQAPAGKTHPALAPSAWSARPGAVDGLPAAMVTQVDLAGYRIERGHATRVSFGSGVVTLDAGADAETAAATLAVLLPEIQARPRANAPAATSADTATEAETSTQTSPETGAETRRAPESPTPASPSSESPSSESPPSVASRPAAAPAQQEPTCAVGGTDSSPRRLRLELGGHYGTATVLVTTNWGNGRTRYAVRAPHVSGSFTVMPERHPDPSAHEPFPTRIEIKYGDVLDGDTFSSYTPYQDAVTIHGIALLGGTCVDPAEATGDGPFRIHAVRPAGPYAATPAPDKTRRRLAALVRGLVRHWLARPDIDVVRLAAARCEAPRRCQEEVAAAQRLQEQIDELIAQRDAHLARAADFRALIAAEPDAPATAIPAEQPRTSAGQEDEGLESDESAPDDPPASDPDTAVAGARVLSERESPPAVSATAMTAPAGTGEHTLVARWPHVAWLIDRVQRLTSEEARAVRANLAGVRDDPAYQQALREAVRVAVDTCRDEAYRWADGSGCAAAVALLTRDQLAPEHYRTLVTPWASVLGRVHPADPAHLSASAGP